MSHKKHTINNRESHILGKKISFCGKKLSTMDFYLLDADHSLNTIESESSVDQCKKCISKMISILKKATNE